MSNIMNRFRKVKRVSKRTQDKILIFSILTLLGLTFLEINLEPQLPDMSCHYDIINNSSRILKEKDILPTRSIFFIESSCTKNLTSRQYCAIESAAKSNPDWQINVLSSGISFETIEKLTQFKNTNNIQFWNIDIKELSIRTPLEELVDDGIYKKSWNIEHMLRVLKDLLIGNWNGIYIDLDVIVMSPLGSLSSNWVTQENDEVIAEAIFKFSNDTVGRYAAASAIRNIQSNFKNRDRCDSPRILNEVLQKLCSTFDVGIMSSTICNGFEVYGSQFFYPIARQRARDLFTPGELENNNAYTYHLWEEDTKDYKVMKGSPYTKLAKIYCPKTYQLYGNNFDS